jgi:hypothetical protein
MSFAIDLSGGNSFDTSRYLLPTSFALLIGNLVVDKTNIITFTSIKILYIGFKGDE